MRKNITAFVAGLLAIGALSYWVWKTQYDEQRVIDPAPLSKHMENFVPKFRPDECLVRLDFTDSGQWTDALSDRIFRNLMRFVSEDRPEMGMIWLNINPGAGKFFVQISDDCQNRYGYMREWTKHYSRRYDNPRFTVSEDHIKPGPETLEAKGFPWID
jgi:hypothetical protein